MADTNDNLLPEEENKVEDVNQPLDEEEVSHLSVLIIITDGRS